MTCTTYTTHHVAGGVEVARPVPKQYRRPLLMDLPLLRFSPSHLSSLAGRAADLSCGQALGASPPLGAEECDGGGGTPS